MNFYNVWSLFNNVCVCVSANVYVLELSVKALALSLIFFNLVCSPF